MRRLTEADLEKITGGMIRDYRIETAKIKRGPFTDSDNYGIILAKNPRGEYVTWQFHLLGDESVSAYWGHYMTDRKEALRDFEARSQDTLQKFHVTITETYQMTIGVEADSPKEAERLISRDWEGRQFTLGPECFAGVEFQVGPANK